MFLEGPEGGTDAGVVAPLRNEQTAKAFLHKLSVRLAVGFLAAMAALALFEGVGLVEEGRLDDRIVNSLGLDVAVGYAAAIRAIGQNDGYSLTGPSVALTGEHAARIEMGDDHSSNRVHP